MGSSSGCCGCYNSNRDPSITDIESISRQKTVLKRSRRRTNDDNKIILTQASDEDFVIVDAERNSKMTKGSNIDEQKGFDQESEEEEEEQQKDEKNYSHPDILNVTASDILTNCTSIEHCIAIQRILTALQYFQSLQINNYQHDLVKYCQQIYESKLLDDYNHIIIDHGHHLESLHNYIEQNFYALLSCDINTCLMYKRWNRDREKLNKSENMQHETFIFYRDLLDQIHCYLLHIFQTGLRIRKSEIQIYINDHIIANDANIGQYDVKITDECFNSIQKHVKQKQSLLSKVGVEFNRFETTKFNVCVDQKGGQEGKEEGDEKEIKMESPESDEKQKKTSPSYFSIGHTFYYWKYYYSTKDGGKQPWYNENDHLGYWPSQLYIKSKYQSLKDEVLNNTIHQISMKKHDIILRKATEYMDTEYTKSIHAESLVDDLHYDIEPGTLLSLNHLMAIVFYTDLTALSTAFSSTFRSLYEGEPLCEVMKRNQEFCNWSRLIREVVQYFGDKVGIKKHDPFYCGTSFMTIPSFVIRLCSPTSTTKQLAVAYNFSSEHGIVMQINNGSILHSQFLRYFNCSWLSCYNDEDERLFCGGNYPLRVESVTLVVSKLNLYWFFKPLFYFDCMMSGVWLSKAEKKNIKRTDCKILRALIDHKFNIKKNKYIDYINETFESFCEHKQQIVINLELINVYFLLLKDIIFESESSLLKVDVILKLFTKCKTFIIYDPSNRYSFQLSTLLSSIFEIMEYGNTNLEEIVIKVKSKSNLDNSWLFWKYNSSDFNLKMNDSQKYGFNLKKQNSRDGSFDVLSASRSQPKVNMDYKSTLSFNEDEMKLLATINDKSLYTETLPLVAQQLIVSYSIGYIHSFSMLHCHKHLKLINNNKSVVMQQEDGWSRRVNCDKIMKSGIHFIEFTVDRLSDSDISIGISNLEYNINRFVGFDRNSYSFACGGKLQHNSDSDYDDPYDSKWKCTPYKTNDKIGMELNLNKYTLTYFKNGKSLGKAFDIEHEKDGGYVFAVSMAYKGDMITIN